MRQVKSKSEKETLSMPTVEYHGKILVGKLASGEMINPVG